jgi:hypothetical protein
MRDPDPNGGGGGGNPNPAPAPITAEAINSLQGDAFRNVLPEDVRGQGWVKDVNTFGDFVKKAAGAQALIGQRATPDEKATPEQWDAWFKQIGRPEKPEGYGLPEIQGIDMAKLKDTPEIKMLQTAMHKAGANPYMAKIAMAEILRSVTAAEKAEAAEAEKAHNTLMDKTFGKDRATIVENGKKYLATVLTPELNAMVGTLPDQALAVVMAMTDAVAKKFGQEDNFRGGQGAGGGSGGETMETLKGQMREIMAQKEYQDPFVNRNKHLELQQKMQGIRDKMQKLSVGA